MSTAEREDKLASAKAQGQAQFDSIKEMVERLRAANSGEYAGSESDRDIERECEEARQAIEEDALSVEVRSGWYVPGARDADTKPAEYTILLCTGGPACRIIGELSEHGEPETARMEVQDWFTPWTEIRPIAGVSVTDNPERERYDYDAEPILLDYARCFYFGE